MKKKERTLKEMIIKLFEPVFAEKRISIKAIIPAIFRSILWMITVYLVKEITNLVGKDWREEVLFLLILLICSVFLWYFILIFTRNWIKVIFWPIFRKYLYTDVIKKFLYSDNNEVEKVWTGKLIAMFNKGIFSWVEILSRILTEVVSSVVFIILSLIFIWFINIYYSLLVLLVLIFIFILTIILQAKAKEYRVLRRDVNIGIMAKFVNILISKFEVLQNWKIDKELKVIWNNLERNIEYNKKVQNYNITIELLTDVLIDWSKIFVIIVFGLGLWTNKINIWEFVSLMSIIYVLDQIFKKSIATYVDFTKIIVDVEKLWDFFDSTPKMKWYNIGKNFEYKKWKIEIENLSYYYVKSNPVFKDFSLKLKWWKVTAFVGNSWSWKSTLVKLIAGYIRANKWNIIIDWQKLNKIRLKSYYKNIWYLTQEPSVFDWTILDNLTYAIDRKLKTWELEKVLKQAKCEFIYDLEDWINTEIWERWVRLSWWQKQRLAIAKIFLKDPKIIILDEPTSALDSFSEEQITYAMHNLFKKRTVIIIAHRLQTVKEADDIILLENGKIKERGNHKELVKLNGQYKKMLDLQSGF